GWVLRSSVLNCPAPRPGPTQAHPHVHFRPHSLYAHPADGRAHRPSGHGRTRHLRSVHAAHGGRPWLGPGCFLHGVRHTEPGLGHRLHFLWHDGRPLWRRAHHSIGRRIGHAGPDRHAPVDR